MQFTVWKGCHFSVPIFPFLFEVHKPMHVRFKCKIDKSFEHEFRDANGSLHENQKDYSKLIGYSLNLLANRKDTGMVGMRWNPNSKKVELTSYWHWKGKRFIGPEQMISMELGKQPVIGRLAMQESQMSKAQSDSTVLMEVDLEEEFFIDFILDKENRSFKIRLENLEGVFVWDDMNFEHCDFSLVRRILSWFGGNFAADDVMCWTIEKVFAMEVNNPMAAKMDRRAAAPRMYNF